MIIPTMSPRTFVYALLPKPPAGKFERADVVPKFLELMRWPYGVSCPYPRCHSPEITKLRNPTRQPEGRYLYYCRKCRRQFTVTTRTVLDRTHVPLAKWLETIALAERLGESLKTRDLVRELQVTPKTARAMRRKLQRSQKDEFLVKLSAALKMYKRPEEIYGRLFPDVYEE